MNEGFCLQGLRLSSKARQSHTAGEIINYMATDAPRLSDTSYMLNDVWNLPLQVAIALAILFQVRRQVHIVPH
jgi:hypothetical protein